MSQKKRGPAGNCKGGNCKDTGTPESEANKGLRLDGEGWPGFRHESGRSMRSPVVPDDETDKMSSFMGSGTEPLLTATLAKEHGSPGKVFAVGMDGAAFAATSKDDKGQTSFMEHARDSALTTPLAATCDGCTARGKVRPAWIMRLRRGWGRMRSGHALFLCH